MLEALNVRQDKEHDDTNELVESWDGPMELFPEQLSFVLQAMLDLTEIITNIH